MRIIISPAKKMNVDSNSLSHESLPRFLPETEKLKNKLQSMSYEGLKNLWGCNDSIAQSNYERLSNMNLTHNVTPAILSYEGIQYKYMAPGVFEYGHLDFITEHLRILSGFYGMLRPFDGVVPYRLEMQAKLTMSDTVNLYGFWGDSLANQLQSETDFVLNLASKEYSRAVLPHLKQSIRVITCIFGELRDGRVVEKGTMCKMARGEMVRFLAESNLTDAESIKTFNLLNYQFSTLLSTEDRYIFIKK